MGKLSAAQLSWLQQTFGDRFTTRRVERKLYGHDIAEMPSLIKPLVGSTLPAGVVQPASEEELVALVQWAAREKIALTPRGKATSGYGGAIPVKGGLVVDFFRLDQVLAVDPAAQTATLQAGIVWEKADQALKKRGFTLTSYPSSYPSSTAGGWLAQGGSGFGSYEAGWFRDTVVSARVVQADGTVKEFSGAELDLIYEAEGITGLISSLTIKIQPDEPLEIISIGCSDAHGVQGLLQDLIEAQAPIWSVHFINPRMAEMKNRAPLLEHQGHPVEERVLLPASYIVTLAIRRRDAATVRALLTEKMKRCEAELLSEKIAHHEWANRFRIMTVKRLGPSLVPAEVVVPLSGLGDMLTEVERKVDQPIVKEGIIIRQGRGGQPEVTILGFIPADQRKFSYNFVFPLSLTIAKIAAKYGGRPYATGLYYTGMAGKILGEERARRLRRHKAQVDPHGILNPGKVIGNGLISTALVTANAFEPLLRPFGNYVITQVGERPTAPIRDIPADVAWYAYACSQCGYCVQECDQYYGRGWESQSPRGKWYWLREYMEGREQWDQFMVDTFLVCTTCELCNLRCSAVLPIEPSWMKLRGQLIEDEKRMTFPPFEMMAAALTAEGDIWAGYRKDRANWFPADLQAQHGPQHKAKTVYFAGCTASYVEQDIGMATVRLLDAAGVDFTYLGPRENCCGTPMLVAGKWEVFAETMRRNIEAVRAAGADTVITSCPACNMMWRHVYPEWARKLGLEYGITAKHYSEVVAEQIQSGTFQFPAQDRAPVTVTWHDSCHMGRVSHVYEEPRAVIQAIPGVQYVEMEHNRDAAHCCGSVLTLIKEPPVAAEIGKTRLDEAVEVGAQQVLAACPCCEFQFRVARDKKQVPVKVVDLARFCAERLGYDFPDPHPEVKAQWAVFEAMIALMTPEGFAQLMGTMWPELIDAMPFGMGKMMRAMGKIPGTLELMKPLFPVLFPRLLPMMMPKVMDTMLARVGAQIPMPDYMAEQMPTLMPKVMDNLMPHMLGDLVPLVTQPMIDYLRGKSA